jgi:flagellar FliL protein
MADDNQQNNEGEEEKKSKKGIIKIIIFVLIAFLLLSVGVGIGLLISSLGRLNDNDIQNLLPPPETPPVISDESEEDVTDKSNKKQITDKKEIFETSYYEFPGNFTANLFNSRKFMQVGIAIGTQYDDEVILNVQKHEYAIRSGIIGLMSNITDDQIMGFESKKKLQEKIKEEINLSLTEKEGFGGVEFVYFTSFVIQ